MHYSQHSNHVRIDFFRPNGKWYTTEEVTWEGPYDDNYLILEEFKRTLEVHLNGRLKGMWAVCLAPYHPNAFPLMVRVPE